MTRKHMLALAALLAGLLLQGGGRAQAPAADAYRASAVAAGQYLCRVLGDDGHFVYNQDPVTGARSPEYNWLRHAGTSVALCQLYAATKDDACRQAAARAAAALGGQIREIQVGARLFTALVDDPAVTHTDVKAGVAVKTGGVALAVVALLQLDDLRQDQAHRDLVLQLCDYLRFTQQATGEPRSKLLLSTGAFTDFRSDYYPGEMLLALALVEAKYPQPANRAALLRLLGFLAAQWERAVAARATEQVAFDHWGLIGLSRVFDALTDDELRGVAAARPLTRAGLLELAVRRCERELNQQQRQPDGDPDAGSFAPHAGETTPTAVRVEGLTAIADLLARQPGAGGREAAAQWAPGVARARRFLLRCQYAPGDMAARGLKLDVTGGFRHGRDLALAGSSPVQIDYCQHAISALLGGWAAGGNP